MSTTCALSEEFNQTNTLTFYVCWFKIGHTHKTSVRRGDVKGVGSVYIREGRRERDRERNKGK